MSQPSSRSAVLSPDVRLDARDPVFRDRPHGILDALRASDPVHQDRTFDRIVLTRAADIAAVLGERSLSVDPFRARPTAYGWRPDRERAIAAMSFFDDPEHARLRGLISKAFTAHAVEAMRERVETIAAELLDAVDRSRPFDLTTAYAAPLPILVIAAMLGIDDADIAQFKRWSDDVELMFSPDRSEEEQRRLIAAFEGVRGVFARTASERRERPRDDLISALAAAEVDGSRLSELEIVNNCRMLLVAGNVTTTALIGNAVVALLLHPEQLARLRADAAMWPSAVEEVLRYDPPVAHWNRQSLEPRRIAGCPVEAGQTITSMLLAANRDPALHDNPHRFDIARKNQKHHSFGGGAHYCLGASLARLEAQISLPALFARFPKLRLAAEPQRRAMPTFNAFEAVWLEAA